VTAVDAARRELQRATRATATWALAGGFLLFFLAATSVYLLIAGGGRVGLASGLVYMLRGPTGVLVSLAAVLFGYAAVVGERERGSLKLVLALPHSRGETVLGKLAGRSAILLGALSAALFVGALRVLVARPDFGIPVYAGFALATLLYGFAYLSLAVAVSAAATSTTVAAVAAFGLWVVLEFLWGVLPRLLLFVVRGLTGSAPDSSLFLAIGNLSPGAAYANVVGGYLGNVAPVRGQTHVTGEPWFGALVLVVWATVPVLLGYARFRAADL
jgi:ABC-2 type transport system permease protein